MMPVMIASLRPLGSCPASACWTRPWSNKWTTTSGPTREIVIMKQATLFKTYVEGNSNMLVHLLWRDVCKSTGCVTTKLLLKRMPHEWNKNSLDAWRISRSGWWSIETLWDSIIEKIWLKKLTTAAATTATITTTTITKNNDSHASNNHSDNEYNVLIN